MNELADADVIPGWFQPPWYAIDWEDLADIEYTAVCEALEQEHPTNFRALEDQLYQQAMAYDAELRFRICHRTWDSGRTWNRIQLRIRRLEGNRVERGGFDYATDDSELSVSEESECSMNSMEEMFQRLCVSDRATRSQVMCDSTEEQRPATTTPDDNAFAE